MDYNPIMFWRNKIIGEMVPCLFEYHKVQTQRVPVKECKNSRELCLVLSALLYAKFMNLLKEEVIFVWIYNMLCL